MIAEDYNYSYQPTSSIPKGTTASRIFDRFRHTVPFYKQAIAHPDIVRPLNENKLTQIFVEQLDIQLRKVNIPIGVKNQYSDLFFGTRGIPDFYFHNLEEGSTSIPLLIVEAKRLPAPSTSIHTEYVKGNNSNGGIERFKIGKHGKGLTICGMLGFVESENSDHWIAEVNSWITNLAQIDPDWFDDEVLNTTYTTTHYTQSDSTVHRKEAEDLLLHHFWIV